MDRKYAIFGDHRGYAGGLAFSVLPLMVTFFVFLAWPDDLEKAGGPLLAAMAVAATLYFIGILSHATQFGTRLFIRKELRALEKAHDRDAVPIWITDRFGLVLSQNPASIEVFGDKRGQNSSRMILRLAANPDDLLAGLFRRAMSDGRAQYPLAHGRLHLSLRLGGEVQVWRYCPDAALRPEEGGNAPDSAPDHDDLPVALLYLTESGEVTGYNRAAAEVFDTLVLGTPLTQLVESVGRSLTKWITHVADGHMDGHAEVLRKRGASDSFVQLTLARLASGGLVGVVYDVTAMKMLETQFVQSQKMQAIGQLAGGIAHDFNNLLTAITGHCDLLMLRHDKSDPEYADLDQISQNANRAAALVGQLLAFSRKQTLKPEIINLRDTLADLTHLLNRLVGERITLTFDHAADLRPIRADKRQLEQVVMNLVVNARDAMSKGGEILILTDNITVDRATRRDEAKLPNGDYVRVRVRDEGCGMSAEQIDKIFEPFYTTKRTGEGTGLGLSTAYGIVKQTGGYIFCESTVDVGTEFSLYFPAYDGEILAPAAVVEEKKPALAGATARDGVVLLVEDEAPVRAFARRALSLQGLQVIEADSAEKALEILQDSQLKVDVFVTDVIMPGMDGPSWVRSALRDRPATKVVFVSGYTEDVFTDEKTPIPNAVFLAKPFSLADLTSVVQAQIER